MHRSLSHRIDESIDMVKKLGSITPLLQLAIDNPDQVQLLIECYMLQFEGIVDVLNGNLKVISREAVAENSSDH